MATFRPVSSHGDAAIDFQSGNKLVSQEKVNHLFLRVCVKKTGLAYECALFDAFGDEFLTARMNRNHRTDSTIGGEQVCLEGGGATIIITPHYHHYHLPHLYSSWMFWRTWFPRSCSDGPQHYQTVCQLTSLVPHPAYL